MHHSRRILPLLVASIATSTLYCSRPATADVDAREYILKTWGDELIVPQYAATHERAITLRQDLETLCASGDPTEANLESARQSWKLTRTEWKRAEVFAFGPHVDFPARYGSMIDFWPVRPDSVEETIDQLATGTLDKQNFSTQVGAASRGLPAIEYALFSTGDTTPPTFEQMRAHLQRPGVCDYLVAASIDLEAQTLGIHDAWSSQQGDYIGHLTDPERFPDGMFMDRTESLSEIVNRMAFTLDNMRRDRLGKPAGEQTGQISLSSQESLYSQHALEDMLATLDMITWLVHGKADTNQQDEALPASQDHYWLADHPRLFQRQDLIADFDAQMATCRARLEALKPSLSQAIEQDPEQIFEVIDELGELQRIIQVDIIQALSLTRTFNDSDGD